MNLDHRRIDAGTPGRNGSAEEDPADARPGSDQGGRPRLLLPVVVVGVLLVALIALAQQRQGFDVNDVLPFTLLLVAAAASAGLRFGPRDEDVAFSFTAVVLLAAIPIVGPAGASVLGIGAAVLDARQGWWLAWVSNGLMFGLSTNVASWVYMASQGAFIGPLGDLRTPAGPTSGVVGLVMHVGLPLLAADAAFILTNLALLAIVAALDPATPTRAVISGAVGTVPTFLAWAVVAFVLVVLWGPAGGGPISVLLVTTPLVLTRHVHSLFSVQGRVRARIIDALARSGRDAGGEVHADRVRAYASTLASDLGLRPGERAALEFAARLHAVGAPGACTAQADPTTAGRDVNQARVASSQILAEVDFLADAAVIVRDSGESYDGTGGPRGLRGSDIPQAARILAVADAADILASGPDGLGAAEVVRRVAAGAGTRFDPLVVDALARALGVDVPGGPPEGAGDRRTRRHRAGATSARRQQVPR